MTPEDRLKEMNIILPEVAAVGHYLPAVKTGNLLFVSGQLPKLEGKVAFQGRVGKDLNLETARRAAKACATNILAVLKQELGNLDRIKKIVRLNGYINSYPGFHEQAKVMDGASELFVDLFGESGRHSRVAVGVVELPLGAAVEIDAIVQFV
ncbi:MAG: RidA family protein [Deltaproteobacteria bacterium]|nr:RidA family protein [Deltaproteobacteria bacterium]MBI2500405.1 RidA family protein [Deltaproteobacteria bacterium]MBI4197135.1 RidA family protein [Deltaproteobacteria bacterium]